MLKRVVDIVGAGAGLILLSPVFMVCTVLVARSMGRPVLFRQQRPVKFRTMSDTRDANGRLLPDGERLTRVGRFLRSTSLDELPELWNVLVGDMSLVGPRPLLMSYLDRYTPQQARRHDVKPGITGWAQINGRNAISWDEKFELDKWYVERQSLLLDFKIIYLTLLQVVRRKDINSPSEATMPEFLGSETVKDKEKSDLI
jgi:sugar transferase EpsL